MLDSGLNLCHVCMDTDRSMPEQDQIGGRVGRGGGYSSRMCAMGLLFSASPLLIIQPTDPSSRAAAPHPPDPPALPVCRACTTSVVPGGGWSSKVKWGWLRGVGFAVKAPRPSA